MAAYVILSKFSPGAFKTPDEFRGASTALTEKLKRECPGIRWKASYATLGHYDVIDVVEADDPAEVNKAAMLIHTDAHATTETMMATPWREYLARI